MKSLIAPPFLFEHIEAVIEGVEPCKSYVFSLKVVGPQGEALAEVGGLELQRLPDIDDYHPPSLYSLFRVDGSAAQLQPGSITARLIYFTKLTIALGGVACPEYNASPLPESDISFQKYLCVVLDKDFASNWIGRILCFVLDEFFLNNSLHT